MDKLNLIQVQSRLSNSQIGIFSLRDFIKVFMVQPKTARSFLSYHSRHGAFTRLRQGIYLANFSPPQKFEIANFLWRPSYISFETALSHYGIIPETIYTITSATSNASREFTVLNQSYQYRKVKKTLFFGYRPVKIRNKLTLIADREKALLDYLYIRSLNKQAFSERLDLRKIDKKKFGLYFNYFKKNIRKSKALISLIKGIQL